MPLRSRKCCQRKRASVPSSVGEGRCRCGGQTPRGSFSPASAERGCDPCPWPPPGPSKPGSGFISPSLRIMVGTSVERCMSGGVVIELDTEEFFRSPDAWSLRPEAAPGRGGAPWAILWNCALMPAASRTTLMSKFCPGDDEFADATRRPRMRFFILGNHRADDAFPRQLRSTSAPLPSHFCWAFMNAGRLLRLQIEVLRSGNVGGLAGRASRVSDDVGTRFSSGGGASVSTRASAEKE